MTRLEVYNDIYTKRKMKLICSESFTGTLDKASRLANIYAVQNTELLFRKANK